MNINPQQLFGNWKEGWALDFHTISSSPIKDENGNITSWNTLRPAIAEELYRLKYWKELYRAIAIGQAAANFIKPKISTWLLDIIIPIPPSDTTRAFQPVYELAHVMGKNLNLPVDLNILQKIKSTTELKSITDEAQRQAILKDAFNVQYAAVQNKDVLLIDDLYRSGETLKATAKVLLDSGKARNVYVLTITKTRAKR